MPEFHEPIMAAFVDVDLAAPKPAFNTCGRQYHRAACFSRTMGTCPYASKSSVGSRRAPEFEFQGLGSGSCLGLRKPEVPVTGAPRLRDFAIEWQGPDALGSGSLP